MTHCPTPADARRIARAPAVLRLLMACGLSVLFCGSPAAHDALQPEDSGHAPAGAPDTSCSALAGLDIPDARILSATRETKPTDHCKVTGLVGGKIGFKVWLPVAWNGRFVMGGAGGFVNVDVNQALQFLGEQILAEGYATASTDTGHAVPNARDGAWALGDWEAIVNYAHLGMHRAVVHAKLVIEGHYLRSIEKSFFFGCSNGGRQALMEAQRYPQDFDGIIAGAPWLNWTGQVAAFIAIAQKMFPDPESLSAALVTRDDRLLLRRAILARCDALDGLRDGILHDPTACDFDPGTLACSADETPGAAACLAPEKVAAIREVYEGPVEDGARLYFGFPFGAEDLDFGGWGGYLADGAPAAGFPNNSTRIGLGAMRYFLRHDPEWSHDDHDWSRWQEDSEPLARLTNATDADLGAFRARGGKLLLYHGWADALLTARGSTDYVNRVFALDATAASDVRLFMIPGAEHCTGQRVPSRVDWLGVLERWHETGVAPDELAATDADRPGSRKICAWPRKAVYVSGDAQDAAAYACR